MAKRVKAVVLDRDGTIIREKNYLSKIRDVEIIPSAPAALAALERAGYILIVATNQSGVARGYLTEKKLRAINRKVVRDFAAKGIKISAVYYCPHPVGGRCGCRKPKTGMLVEAGRKFGFDAAASFCVGDKLTDIEFGKNGGMKSVMVMTGHGRKEFDGIAPRGRISPRLAENKKPDFVAKNLAAAAKWILKQS